MSLQNILGSQQVNNFFNPDAFFAPGLPWDAILSSPAGYYPSLCAHSHGSDHFERSGLEQSTHDWNCTFSHALGDILGCFVRLTLTVLPLSERRTWTSKTCQFTTSCSLCWVKSTEFSLQGPHCEPWKPTVLLTFSTTWPMH